MCALQSECSLIECCLGDDVEPLTLRFIGHIRSEAKKKKKLKCVSPAQVLIESVGISAKMSAATKVITVGVVFKCSFHKFFLLLLVGFKLNNLVV